MKNFRQSMDSLKLMEHRSAACFNEAYPIGNGSLGAMIYGDTENERIGLNHDTLWTGYPRTEDFAGDGKKSLDRAKEMLLKGNYLGAEKEISDNFGSYASEAYLPLGELTISMPKAQKIKQYRRTLDLKKALARVEYKRDNIRYSVASFVSAPDNVIIYRIEAHNGNGDLSDTINLTVGAQSRLYSKTYTENGFLYMEGECPVTSEQNIKRTDRKTQYFDTPKKRGIRFICIADIITDGKKTDMMNSISIRNASFCEIRICIETSFNGYDRHPYTDGRDYRNICSKKCDSLSSKSYDEILRAHVKDHSEYWGRVSLELGSDNKSNIPTSERLRRFECGERDRALPVLLFNFGRYLTIASSRKGSQATNLQGIWNDKYMPPWHSNYTVNINTQMNYWPTLAVGMTEMYEPLIRLIQELAEAGRITADTFYGADGWCCHHNTDIWRHTQPVPVKGYPQCFFWNGSGGWLCRHLYEYYEYTLDRDFLRNTAYPIIREAVKFYLSQLITLDGYRIVFPSTSPENAFLHNGERASISETTEMTMAIVRELFSSYIKVCDILGIKDELGEKVKGELPNLLPPCISSDGRVLEWYGERIEKDKNHRHISHLYAFYPSHCYRPDNAPELCEACSRSLEVRGDGGTGWGLAWKACLYAALGNGKKAYDLIKKQLRLCEDNTNNSNGGGVYTNMFGSCPPFQIDSNFGTTAAIAEMLLQSDMDTLHIIPAIPDEWDNISVKGLCAKGKRSVSFTVRNGELAECEISGSIPSKIIVAGGDMTDKFIHNEKGCCLK